MVAVKNSYRAGDTVSIEVFRSGETFTLNLTFDEQDNNTQSSGTQDPPAQPTSSGNYGSQYPYGGDGGDEFFNNFPWSYFFRR